MKTITVEKPASKGIVMGKAFIVVQENLVADNRMIQDGEKEAELSKFKNAVEEAAKQIGVLAETNEIFGAHLEVAQDAFLHESVEAKIMEENKNAELALEESKDEICAMFAGMEDEYLKERASDIKDVCKRILSIIKGVAMNPFANIDGQVIVVANDLAPSDTANMDFTKVLGFITEVGGITSHVCIMARSLEIPALVGVTDFISHVQNGDYIILDGIHGSIFINPDDDTIEEYEKKADEYKKKKEELLKLNGLPAETKDGRTVELFANVGSITDVENAMKHGAEGIGLFRSEFLYMESKGSFPSEETQYEVYKKAIELCEGKTMIIRTLDIGGDKELSYYEFDKEENPFLGWRAIRICLEMKDVFKAQLRALLRASAFGDIRIMLPMIISVEEYRAAKEVLLECMTELKEEGIAYNEKIELGIMVETPAAVLMAEDLAKEVDFFSIGTNDLTQYVLAVDRGNQKISKMYNSFHPAVLRSIQKVIEAGHKYGKMVGMCGEFASDEKAMPILLGLGLDEFSMAANDIAVTRYNIRNTSYAETQKLAQEICSKATYDEIKEIIG